MIDDVLRNRRGADELGDVLNFSEALANGKE